MLINKDTGKFSNPEIPISTSRILLVPYDAHHVPTYHDWMQDEEIQQTTASEPLNLSSEYSMQRSWRQDGDKLTFIACMPLSPNPSPCPAPQDSIGGEIAGETAIQADEAPITIRVGEYDSPALMLGDVNLFLSQADDDDDKKEADESGGSSCIGELELMIAPPASRRHGYGRAAMLAFLHYINQHQDSILSEYATSVHHAPSPHDPEKAPKQKMQLRCLRVKIAQQNAKSIALFESIGFAKRTAQPNYFGELELRFDAFGGAEGPDASAGSWLPEGYRELRYERQC